MTDGKQGEGAHRALIVDDEPALRRILERMLDRLGVQADQVESGQGALDLLSEAPEAFSIVLLDRNLGTGMSGEQTFEALRKLNEKLPVLFLSGAAGPDITAPATGFLSKPFSVDALRTALEELIGLDG